MSTLHRPASRRGPGFRTVAVLLVAGGCGGGSLAPDVPRHRPADGLIGDAELQAVVDLQVRRDGPQLAALLASERASVRARAAFALASVQDAATGAALVAVLGDADAGVRRDAAFALGQLHDPAAVGPLADAYAAEDAAEVRLRILEALGKVPSLTAVKVLMELDVPPAEEAQATLALSLLGALRDVVTEESLALLLARLDDPRREVRAAAAYYFGRVETTRHWVSAAPRVRQALDSYALDAPEAMYLVQALGKLRDPQDGERLRDWLTRGKDWRTRANAAAALGSLPPDPTNRERLTEALDDPSALVSDQAAQALARSALLPSEVPFLESWIRTHRDRVPAVAPLLGALARADDREFVFPWLDALAMDDVVGWSAGLPALASMPGQDAVNRLLRAAGSDNPRIQGTAVTALVRRWNLEGAAGAGPDDYFRVFEQAVRSGNVRAASAAAAALADPAFAPLGGVQALMSAYQAMEEPEDLEAMMAVLDALGAAGSADALPVVRAALSDPTPAVRQSAARALAALGGTPPPPEEEESPAAQGAPAPQVDWAYLAGLGAAPRWVLETDRGRVVVVLDPEEAPLTVQTIARLSEEGRYDGVLFHRVVPNFVAQGGDFASGDGFGGPGFTITSEFTEVPYLRGTAGMASAGKDTEGSQFFFTHSMQPHLDGSYTAFGWIVSGMDAVDALDVGDRIVRATIERGG